MVGNIFTTLLTGLTKKVSAILYRIYFLNFMILALYFLFFSPFIFLRFFLFIIIHFYICLFDFYFYFLKRLHRLYCEKDYFFSKMIYIYYLIIK